MVLPIVIGILTGATLFYTAQLVPRVIQRVTMAGCSPIASATASSFRGASAPYHIYEYGFKKAMTEKEACMLLGFSRRDSGLFYSPPEEEVKRRYRELMRELHTDVGGSPYIATKLNEAKDILTRQATRVKLEVYSTGRGFFPLLWDYLMFREDMAELFEASAKLDKILSTAAQRRILYFKPQETTTSTANSVTDTIAMRVSFSYLPTLTTSIQVFEVEEPSLSAAQPTMENESVQLSAELAVAVQPAILSKQIQSYLKVFVEKSGLTSSQNFDIVVKGFKAVTTASSFQWLENPIILSTSLIAQLPQSLVPLMLFLFPEHEGLWGARRAKLSELRHQETLLHMRQDDSNNITQHIAKSDDFLVDCVKEFLLTDLLLSFFFKMKAIWFHREWLLKLMIESHLLSDKGGILLPQFGDVQRACFFSSAASVNRGPEIDEKLSPTVKTLDLRTFLTLDDEVLSFASDKHPLNYNAWHYRRARLTLLRCCSHHCRPVRDATNPIYRDLLQPSAESVMRFLETHNADSSACSFLLFLLHQCASDETRDLHGGSNTAGLPYHLRASAAEVPLSVVLWCRLLCFTQRELHRHVDKGHEGMWHLRLGLIRYALSISSKKSSLHHPLLSSWTVADELAWVSVYAEGYHDMSAVSVGSSECDKGLLTPSGDPAKAWVESSGSAAWSSYLATRYGLQLLQSLRLSKTSET